MKVYEIGDYTKGLSLHKVERPEPVPGHGEAVMRVRATGINARDLSIMEGALGKNVMPYTRVPLSDNAGLSVARIDCAPCYQRECPLGHHRCMRDTSPDQIAVKLEALLAGSGAEQ